ncbi:MAG TPA: HAD family phosphatase [Ignavibacteria bacterium]|nr:HAD family phosphatase [Ignavibacteria bacterium]HMR39761.1 HAD family phosphatase [Ignavibacteria bacterium]
MTDKVVIFDMDGVLIDSEPAYLEMNLRMFDQFGINMDDETYKALVGMPSVPMWKFLKEKYELENEISDFIHLEKRRMLEILDSDIITKPVEGINELIEILKKNNVRLSVASSSAKDNVNFVLEKLKIKNNFDFIISGEEVEKGKPSPDIFLKVADHFDQNPGSFYVIEDSANGINAANSAGMKSIGFTNSSTNMQDLSGADLIINDFDENGREKILKFILSN